MYLEGPEERVRNTIKKRMYTVLGPEKEENEGKKCERRKKGEKNGRRNKQD